MFYESCYNSEKEQNSWNTYKENTSYYISGQIFKIIEISGNRYCIFVKTDSVDIKKVSPDLYYFSGIYDKKNNIVLLVQHLMLLMRKEIEKKNILIS